MRLHGLLIVILLLATPIWWVIDLANQHPISPLIAQYLGLAAVTAMAIAQILATRMRWLEPVFGGMDRVYILHKWLGIGAVAAILMHDAIGAEVDGEGVIPGMAKGALSRWLGDEGDEAGEELGELALNGLLALIAVTMLSFVPYRWWHWTHRLMGAVFALAVLHVLMVDKPFKLSDPLGLHLGTFAVLGLIAYLYTLLPFGRALAQHAYVVKKVERSGEALAVTLDPVGKGLSHAPGQFAFVTFLAPGIGETHPFTISSPPFSDGSRTLRCTIKQAGDYTRRVHEELQPDTRVSIAGPYGRFIRRPASKTEIWIAGGIGITPFLAWAGAMGKDEAPVHLFYCVKCRSRAAHMDELEAAARANPQLTLHLVESETGPRLTPGAIAQAVGAPLTACRAYFCGPKAMGDELSQGLGRLGLPRRRFVREVFEIRSVWPVDAIMRRFLGRFGPKSAGSPAVTAARMPR